MAIEREGGQIVRKINATTADYAMLNQGQLKATAALFYERLGGRRDRRKSRSESTRWDVLILY